MTTEITMPKLSDTMTEGVFASWRKNIGDKIERGDIIAEVETDKAVMELEAFTSGLLVKTMVQGGETVQVGAALGLVGTAEDLAAAKGEEQTSPPVHNQPEPEPKTEAKLEPEIEPEHDESTPPTPQSHAPSDAESGHEKASPLVRRLARERNIDLEKIVGSGPDGRITQEDLEAYTGTLDKKETVVEAAETPVTTPPEVSTTRTQPGSIRQAISNTVTRSWQTIPHFSVTVEIDMDACKEIVGELKSGSTPIGFNSIVIKACAVALLKFPLFRPATEAASDDINISFAVSLPDGLLMPVIRGCQRLSVIEIEAESTRLAEKSRAGRLGSEEMSGGTFSISNLGMYGVDEFNALIMPGQVAILAVGAVKERAVVRNGTVTAAPTLRVTLSSDHRSIDGAYAASFLAELRSILEKPVSLLMVGANI